MMRTLLVLLLVGSACAAAPAGRRFQWGVNGHPLVQEGYRQVPVAIQLDLVGQLGAGWYRCDWYQAALEKEPASYDALVAQAAKRRLRILPVIFPTLSCRSDAALEAIQSASFRFARDVARRFRGRITHWELDNELDILTMVRRGETQRTGVLWQWGDADGDRPEQFEETRYARARAEMLGLSEGIKAGDPSARTLIDCAGWLHFGFFERLVREDHVPFDILGWHWYSEMGDMTRVRGSLNVLEVLKGFGKPIWVTEANRRGGSQGGREDPQAEYLAGLARQLRPSPGVEAFFAYELLDEPYFGANSPESHYGLVEVGRGPDGRWCAGRPKAAFEALRAVFRDRREALPPALAAPP